MDVSNKTLAFILVISIVVTLGVAFVSIGRLSSLQNMAVTGMATGNQTASGTSTLTISSTARLIFQDPAIDWGTGSVNTTSGNLFCNLTTTSSNDGANKCLDFSSQADGLILRNDGNTKFTSVWLNSSHTAATFVGGSNPSLKIKATEPEGAATCTGTLNFSTMTEVAAAFVATPGPKLCTDGFNYNESIDDIYIAVNLTVPYNSLTGERTVTFAAKAEY
ncbi:MAG: hypothetical protein V1659_02635 [Candidatus Woesearchaeota archaeon]